MILNKSDHMSNDNNISFFTPIEFNSYNNSIWAKISEKMDNYLYRGGIKASVEASTDSRHYEVKFSHEKESTDKKIKMLSYFLSLGAAPLAAIFVKVISRLYYKFTVVKVEDSSSDVSDTASSVSSASSDQLTGEDEVDALRDLPDADKPLEGMEDVQEDQPDVPANNPMRDLLDLAQANDRFKLSVAKYYENGSNDFPKDEVEAAKWYLIMAKQGNKAAIRKIALWVKKGKGGLSSDMDLDAWDIANEYDKKN